ncbi:right-handed parallel beta-helix repeat-containing protein, partial [Candidatus Pacearchaeota archaeon]|nr:right-handed parallel beta-helix repeat-containing protein [Candidatus Pacearchaeota archaeon]
MRGFGSPLGAFIEAVETISEMKKITVFLTLFSLIVLFPTVSAITFVVNQTANCTAGDSYHSTIQSAINDANTGDLIIVCNGTYNENVNVDKPLNIQSYSQNPSDTIVNATNSGDHGFEITADSVNLSGFEVRGAREDLIGGISLIEADYCSISGNSLSNNRIGIYLSSSSNNLVTNNTASTDLCSAMKIGSCAGVRLDCGYGSSLPTQNNTVENNTVSAPGTGDGIALHGTGSCQLTTNNTVDNNMDTNSGVGVVLAYVSNNTVSNNVLNFN